MPCALKRSGEPVPLLSTVYCEFFDTIVWTPASSGVSGVPVIGVRDAQFHLNMRTRSLWEQTAWWLRDPTPTPRTSLMNTFYERNRASKTTVTRVKPVKTQPPKKESPRRTVCRPSLVLSSALHPRAPLENLERYFCDCSENLCEFIYGAKACMAPLITDFCKVAHSLCRPVCCTFVRP
jgi:hypothetical protein